MGSSGTRGEIKDRGISGEDLSAARALAVVCNAYEGLDLPLHFEPSADQCVYYEDRALIGAATLHGQPEVEVSLAVHPGHRRRGIGRRLLEVVQAECRRRGRPSCLLVCEAASTSGLGFIAAMGGRYRSAEHRMRLDPGAVDLTRSPRTSLRVEPVTPADVGAVAEILAASFESDAGREQQRLARDLQKPTHRYFLARLRDEIIGNFGLVIADGHVYIIGFGVLPSWRGQGHGRTMLCDAVALLTSEGWREILLEVATDNEPAVGLYRSSGFRVTSTYDFYDVEC